MRRNEAPALYAQDARVYNMHKAINFGLTEMQLKGFSF
jgi:hypothetical protein